MCAIPHLASRLSLQSGSHPSHSMFHAFCDDMWCRPWHWSYHVLSNGSSLKSAVHGLQFNSWWLLLSPFFINSITTNGISAGKTRFSVISSSQPLTKFFISEWLNLRYLLLSFYYQRSMWEFWWLGIKAKLPIPLPPYCCRIASQ